jgi:hypothetical protein
VLAGACAAALPAILATMSAVTARLKMAIERIELAWHSDVQRIMMFSYVGEEGNHTISQA